MTPIQPSSPFPGGQPSGGAPPPGSAPSTPSTGSIGRYQVLEKIGEGGMGSLYLARDPAIDRLVAIKLLRRGFDTEALRERFAREARAAGRLRHPNIVTIFDVGEHDGDPFIAMEFLAGETLGELIRHGAGLSLSRRLKLLEELCDGLAYAHRAGLVHRDIKPANLMVDAEGVLKILDFGIVRVGDSGMTQAGVLVGTINYMAPEQVMGANVDHRSDIFAVGLVAYELLSGRQAFPGTLKEGLLRRIPGAEIEPLASVAFGLDEEVVRIVEHALQKEPGDRYQELARMRNDLARARQRIEAEEERVAVEAASASAETALISQEVTAPGVPVPASGPHGPGVSLLALAERALQEGNFRHALSMAGRAAAVDPQDRNPSGIVARAEAALLERGRTFDIPRLPPPPSGPGSAAPVSPLPLSSPTAGTAASAPANYLAVGVAVVALLVAGFAVWSQIGSRGPSGRQVESGAPASTAGETAASSSPSAAPASPATPEAPGATPPETVRQQEAAQPPAASPDKPADTGPSRPPDTQASGRGTARGSSRDDRREPASRTQPASRDRAGAGRTASPPPPDPAPSAPPRVDPPVPTLPVTSGAPGVLPGAAGAHPIIPTPPPKPVDKPQTRPVEQKAEPPRDLRAEAEAGVRSALRRYEAAWEALNFEALARVQAIPNADTVRDSMREMREYAMDVEIQRITVAPDNQSATAVCRVERSFLGPAGSRQTHTHISTFALEKRGDNWLITSLR